MLTFFVYKNLIQFLIYLLLNKTNLISNYSKTDIIAKIDSNSGQTMWAKTIHIEYQSNLAFISSLQIIDDYAWVSHL